MGSMVSWDPASLTGQGMKNSAEQQMKSGKEPAFPSLKHPPTVSPPPPPRDRQDAPVPPSRPRKRAQAVQGLSPHTGISHCILGHWPVPSFLLLQENDATVRSRLTRPNTLSGPPHSEGPWFLPRHTVLRSLVAHLRCH